MGVNHFIFSCPILIITIFIICFLTPSPSNSLSFAVQNNFTLYGDAHFIKDAISLTQEYNHLQPPPTPTSSPSFATGIGRALYRYPIRFLDPQTNTTASFSCRFSFTITTSPSFPCGDGLAFLITSNATSVTNAPGHFGLPTLENGSKESFFAVEFDTSFDPNLGDINDNHIGVDFDTVVSFASVGVDYMGINLKSGRLITAWIQYEEDTKMLNVWVSNSQFKPREPVISTNIDLSENVFEEFMHIGFSASNRPVGSSRHVLESWQFKTFGFVSPETTTGPYDVGENGCAMCLPENEDFAIQDRFLHSQPSGKLQKLDEAAVGLGGGAALLIVSTAVIGLCVWWKRVKGRRPGSMTRRIGRALPARLSLAEITSATRGFHRSRIIGEGASGVVYEGSLASGKEVAVKRFNRMSQIDQSVDPFAHEVTAMLGCLKHKNLVQLIGWCCEGGELVLVYEHLANGSLEKFLHRTTSGAPDFLSWPHRQKIVLGIASALTYLHEECETQIIHRDVKACNIMLDADFNAKLGDFGLAELYERRLNISAREATITAGTIGYLAPEYVHSGVPTDKTDVYSFGVVALEVATGKQPVEGRTVLVDWVWEMWAKGKLMEAADTRLMGRFDRMEMEGMLMVGLSCVHPDCTKRSTMKEAERILRGDAPFPILPSRKPELRLVSLPQGAEDILQENRNLEPSSPPWATPRSHFI